MRQARRFATSVLQVNNSTRKHGISVSRLFKLLDRRSNYILTLTAFLLVVVPLPTPPGFSTILALPSIFITAQICCLNDRVYIPRWLSKIKINKIFIKKIDRASRWYLQYAEKLTKRRFVFFVSPTLHKVYNIVLLFFAFASAIPVPFLCMIPALAGVLMSAGLIVKDGILILAAMLVGCFGSGLIYLTIKTLILLKEYIPL